MSQNAKKANATGRNTAPAAKVEAVAVTVPATSSKIIVQPEIEGKIVSHTRAKGRVVRGHKYDGKTLSEKGLDVKLEAGKAPNGPRGNGKPSVMYRIFQMVAAEPDLSVGKLIQTMQGQKFDQHPTPYGKTVDETPVSPLWCMGYIKGAVAKGFLKVAE